MGYGMIPVIRVQPDLPIRLGVYVDVYGIRDAVITELHPESDPPYWVATGWIEVFDRDRTKINLEAQIMETYPTGASE